MKYSLKALEKEPGRKERTKGKNGRKKERNREYTQQRGRRKQKNKDSLQGFLERVGEGARKEREDARRKIYEKKEGEGDSTERERDI